MPLIFVTVVAVVFLVIVTRGSFARLGRIRLRAWWLLILGLGIQVALEFVDFAPDQIDTIGFALLMASYAALLGFCIVNLPRRGMEIVTLGIALNALVIGLNQGMPATPVGEDAQGHRIEESFKETVKHQPATDHDRLGFLADTIVLPNPFDVVISIGDIILMIGVVDVCYHASRRRRTRGAHAPTRRGARARAPAAATGPLSVEP